MGKQLTEVNNIIALDVGERRIGVAIANSLARLPHPLLTIDRKTDYWQQLKTILRDEQVAKIIVGLPRSREGQETAQTAATRNFIAELGQHFDLPIELQDEALTSVKAETELGKKGKTYTKADVDALAATYILEDYLSGIGQHA